MTVRKAKKGFVTLFLLGEDTFIPGKIISLTKEEKKSIP